MAPRQAPGAGGNVGRQMVTVGARLRNTAALAADWAMAEAARGLPRAYRHWTKADRRRAW